MNQSDEPQKIDVLWASQAGPAYVRQVPDTVQQPTFPFAASFATGFPPDTFLPTAAGGSGPDGRDMNGILQQLSAWAQWVAAGGPIIYDAVFQSAVGGYPKFALVQSAATEGQFWLSTVENNMTDPDNAGVGWVSLFAFLTGSNNTWSGTNAFGSGATVSTPSTNNNSTSVPNTSWLWSNIQALVASCIAAVASTAGFAVSVGANGYIKFPGWLGGFMVQWGQVGGSAPFYPSFATPFPTQCFAVVATPNSTSSNTYGVNISNVNQSQFQVWPNQGDAGVTLSLTYIAIGY